MSISVETLALAKNYANKKVESLGTVLSVKGVLSSVEELPSSAAAGDLYFVGPLDETNNYSEYIYTTMNQWENLGEIQKVDLEAYATKEQLNDKADLDSPIFTGFPEAPTQHYSTKDDTLATTAFVKNIIARRFLPDSPTLPPRTDIVQVPVDCRINMPTQNCCFVMVYDNYENTERQDSNVDVITIDVLTGQLYHAVQDSEFDLSIKHNWQKVNDIEALNEKTDSINASLLNKVEYADLNALEIQINDMQSEVNRKADSSAVNTLNEDIAKLKTDVKTVADKVATTENLTTQVEQNTSDIENLKAMSRIDMPTSWSEIKALGAKAEQVFKIGDQIMETWTDVEVSKGYIVPHNVIGFVDKNVLQEDGSVVPTRCMAIQWHYTTPFGVMFDNREAFYVAENEALPAGTYYVKLQGDWGTHVKDGKVYKFTTTKAVPVGGMLCGFNDAPSNAPSTWKVYAYNNGTTNTANETVTVAEVEETEGMEFIAVLSNTANIEGENAFAHVGFGCNSWKYSGIRQWLNSTERKNLWWESQKKYDRAPSELASKAGFLSGYSEDFVNTIATVEVTTATNNKTFAEGYDVTYDKIVLPSLEEMYIAPQKTGEGEAYDLYKIINGSDTPFKQFNTYTNLIRTGVENRANKQSVRLRSASRGGGGNTWHVTSSGYVYSGGYAYGSWRGCPIALIPLYNL